MELFNMDFPIRAAHSWGLPFVVALQGKQTFNGIFYLVVQETCLVLILTCFGTAQQLCVGTA